MNENKKKEIPEIKNKKRHLLHENNGINYKINKDYIKIIKREK